MSGVDAVNLSFLADATMQAGVSRSSASPVANFEAVLTQMAAAPADNGSRDTETSLRTAAENLVSSAFVTPVLAALRANSQAEGPFAPGTAERRFGPMLDQHIADSIVKGGNFGLVDSIVDRFLPAEHVAPRTELTA